jgi:hypothetical protein
MFFLLVYENAAQGQSYSKKSRTFDWLVDVVDIEAHMD